MSMLLHCFEVAQRCYAPDIPTVPDMEPGEQPFNIPAQLFMEPGEEGNKTKHDVSVYNWVRTWRYGKDMVQCHESKSSEINLQSKQYQSFEF